MKDDSEGTVARRLVRVVRVVEAVANVAALATEVHHMRLGLALRLVSAGAGVLAAILSHYV